VVSTRVRSNKFLAERAGVSPEIAKVIAGRVRQNLYQGNRWLPQDDPGAWSHINASLGRIPTAKDKADAIMSVLGIEPAHGGGNVATFIGTMMKFKGLTYQHSGVYSHLNNIIGVDCSGLRVSGCMGDRAYRPGGHRRHPGS